MEILRRNEEGIRSIGLLWHDVPWARKAFEVLWHRPTLRDCFIPKDRFVLEIKWGPGAGYINGWTGFLGWKCKNRQDYNLIHQRKLCQFGITRNANKIPYVY